MEGPAQHPASGTRHDLALICGYGGLPGEILNGALAAGRSPYLFGIKGEAEPVIAGHPVEILSWGQFGHLLDRLAELGIREVVFAGGIHKRPEMMELKLDWGAIKALPKILGFMVGGDNTVLSGLMKLFEGHGISIVGAHQIAPGLLAGAGAIAGKRPASRQMENIRLGFEVCKAVGQFDIGQAAIAEAGRVIAIEGVEGTDEMLSRIVRMREIGRMPVEGKHGVLVKTMKPGQDIRADLPAIGPRTVEGVLRAGLRGIAIEAGHSIILEKEATLDLARKSGIFIFGASASDLGKANGNG
ncbi:MAG: UDP-2,3-diacylglucosamine diphosphatase LpxI [Nitratireductor sp.]